MKRQLFLIFLTMLIAVFSYKYSSFHLTKEKALQVHLETISYTTKPVQLVKVVETDIPDIYYLLIKSNDSNTINTVSNVKIKKTILGWRITPSSEKANAVIDLTNYLLDSDFPENSHKK